MTNKDNNLSENTKNTFKDLQDMMNSDPNLGHLFKDDNCCEECCDMEFNYEEGTAFVCKDKSCKCHSDDSDKFKDEQREQEREDEYQSEPTPN